MRILIIGHSYVGGEARKKLAALAAHDDLTVGAVVPRRVPHPFMLHSYRREPWDEKYSVFPVRYWGGRHLYGAVFDPAAVWRAVAGFRPDLVQIEEEPGSLALAEVQLIWRRKGPTIGFSWENQYGSLPIWRRRLERFTLSRTDGFIAGNSAVVGLLGRKGFHGPTVTMPNVGVDCRRFVRLPASELRRELGIEGSFVVGFVGRFVEEKGCVDLIRAIARLPQDTIGVFLGAGPLESHMRELVANLGIGKRVRIRQAVPHSEVAAFLGCMDVLVLPSRTKPNVWAEQFGLVLAQAMASEVAVVGSDSGAIPEVIGEAGLVFPEGDVAALASRLRLLYDQSDERGRLARAGRSRVETLFSNEALASRSVTFYREILAGRH